MLEVNLLGHNGLQVQVDDTGQVQVSPTACCPISESINFTGLYDNAIILGQYQNQLLPLQINENGEIIPSD